MSKVINGFPATPKPQVSNYQGRERERVCVCVCEKIYYVMEKMLSFGFPASNGIATSGSQRLLPKHHEEVQHGWKTMPHCEGDLPQRACSTDSVIKQ